MEIKATVQIGKSGITQGIKEEIKTQLKKKKIIKIKFLQNSDRDNFKEKIEELARDVNAEIVEIRGFTTILKKK